MNTETANTKVNGTTRERAFQRRTITPPVDIYENADEILVVADVPGVAPDRVQVFFEGDMLKLEAQRTANGDVRYERSFRVPAHVNLDAVSADAKNGTVVIHLPKSLHARKKLIPIRVK